MSTTIPNDPSVIKSNLELLLKAQRSYCAEAFIKLPPALRKHHMDKVMNARVPELFSVSPCPTPVKPGFSNIDVIIISGISAISGALIAVIATSLFL